MTHYSRWRQTLLADIAEVRRITAYGFLGAPAPAMGTTQLPIVTAAYLHSAASQRAPKSCWTTTCTVSVDLSQEPVVSRDSQGRFHVCTLTLRTLSRLDHTGPIRI